MARYGIISDIHGNRFALEAVLARLGELEIDEIICLGDVVGYGPHPAECVDCVVRYASHLIRGNHEEALLSPAVATGFNGAAREAINWTRTALGPLHLQAISRMRSTLQLNAGELSIQCIHDSPYPGPTDYVHDQRVAALAFRGVEAEICLIGHTHVPMVFVAHNTDPGAELTPLSIDAHIPSDGYEIPLGEGRRYICNPGSVGQPRDCDPRAALAVLDTDARTFMVSRVEYDIAAAQAATEAAGLPTVLADRLAIGA